MTVRSIVQALRQRFCSHDWTYTRYQALVDDGRFGVVCTKCGKRDRGFLLTSMIRAMKGGKP